MIGLLRRLAASPWPDVRLLALALLHGEDCWPQLWDALEENGQSLSLITED